jgi:hypothetical protein
MTITTVGYGDITAETTWERIGYSLFFIVCAFSWGELIAGIFFSRYILFFILCAFSALGRAHHRHFFVGAFRSFLCQRRMRRIL